MVSARCIDRAGPHAALIFGAAGFGGYFVLTKASLSGGVDPFVFGTYRDGIGFLTLFLYASCFERQHWPKMSLEVAGLVFAMAVVGQWFFVEWKEQKTHCLINCTARSLHIQQRESKIYCMKT
ncbi:hypothetical protein KC19_8G000400 [Ceratodon purpureus]|uniref:EamA domain-containing protein n=1 Tax=Ceratodon purpureus TaxID=3225 RepID=A0A8T0GTP1_CERPU|nr:hypothetical protein KC19_8G000400 [Ceratodon purpureus]